MNRARADIHDGPAARPDHSQVRSGKARSEHIPSGLPPRADMVACHDTQFMAAKVSMTARLLTLMMPMPG